MIRLMFIGFTAIVFSACSMKDVVKPVVKYSLEDDVVVQKEAKPTDKVLKMVKIKSPEYLQNEKIWYKTKALETNSYLYSSWNGDFVDIVEQNIAASIYNSGIFKSIFTKYSKIDADLFLESELIEAKQIVIDDANADVVFKIRIYLVDAKSYKLIGSKEFGYLEKSTSVDAKGAILAYNDIVKKLNKDVVRWLKILVKES